MLQASKLISRVSLPKKYTVCQRFGKNIVGFSTNAGGTGLGAKLSWTLPWYIRRGIRVVQVSVIAYSIYSLGYQLGVMETAQFPLETEQKMIEAALPLGSATKEELERFVTIENTPEYQRVKKVLHRVLSSARDILEERIKGLDPTTEGELRERLLVGHQKLNGNWNLVLFPSNDVNAFVTGLCPRKVFVFTGLLEQVHPTDDELAVILSHELSHIILGHNEGKGGSAAFLLSLQLVLLSLVDPLGISALFYDYLANILRKIVDASYSRTIETEADLLGVEITANACFDIRKGVGVMQKLAMVSQNITIDPSHHSHTQPYRHIQKIDEPTSESKSDKSTPVDGLPSDPLSKVQNGIENVVEIISSQPTLPKRVATSWLDSHPSSTERFEFLQLVAEKMIAEFQEDYTTRNSRVKPSTIHSQDNNSALSHITRPNHCYGLWADLERCGIPFTRWLWS
jgi:Zn-dependent protease with chaperone function